MKKAAAFFSLLLLALHGNGQTVQTGMSPPLFFYPSYFKKNNIYAVGITEYYRVYKKKKIGLTKPIARGEFLLDGEGNSTALVQFEKRGSDTVSLGPDTVVDGKVILKSERDQALHSLFIKRFDGEEKYVSDSLGRLIFSQRVKVEVESPTHVFKDFWQYDKEGKPITYDFHYGYLVFKNNQWDTVTLIMTNYLFHYNEDGLLASIDEKYNSIQGMVTNTRYEFIYKGNEIVIRDKNEPTERLPEKYYAVLKLKRRIKK